MYGINTVKGLAIYDAKPYFITEITQWNSYTIFCTNTLQEFVFSVAILKQFLHYIDSIHPKPCQEVMMYTLHI